MRCQYCGKRLPLFRKLTDGEFCSPAHRKLFFDQQEQLALGRLLETGKRSKTPTRANLEAELAAAKGGGNGRAPVITESSIPPAWDRFLGDRPPIIPLGEIANVVPAPFDISVALMMPEPERSLFRLQGSLSVDEFVEIEAGLDVPADPAMLAAGEMTPLPLGGGRPNLTVTASLSVEAPTHWNQEWKAPEAGLRALWRADFLSSRGWKAAVLTWPPAWLEDESAPWQVYSPSLASGAGEFAVELIRVEPDLEARRLVEHQLAWPVEIRTRGGAELGWRDVTAGEVTPSEFTVELVGPLTIEPFEYAQGPVAARRFEQMFALVFQGASVARDSAAGSVAIPDVRSLRQVLEPSRTLRFDGAGPSIEVATATLAALRVELGAARDQQSGALAYPELRALRARRRVVGVRPTKKQVEGFEPARAERMKRPYDAAAFAGRTTEAPGRMFGAVRRLRAARPRVKLSLRGGGPAASAKMQSLSFVVKPADGLALTERAAEWMITGTPRKPRLAVKTMPPGQRSKASAAMSAMRSSGASVWTRVWAHAPADIRWVTMIIPLVLFLAWYSFTPKGQVISRQGAQGTVTVPAVNVSNSGFSSVMKSFEERISARAAVELSDDFRGGLGNWEGEGEWSDSWSYDQTGFVHPGRMALYKPSVSLTDYKFEFLGKIEKRSLAWVYRATDLRNYYGAKLQVLQNGPVPKVALVRYTVVNGKERDRKQVLVPLNTLRQDTIYRVRVDVNGDQFTTSVLGQIVDTYKDPTHSKGGIGFFAPRGEESRVRWVELSHQYDTLGRLCALIVPYGAGNSETRTP